MFALKSCVIKALNVERVSIEGRGPRPHISCIEKSLACRQAVKIATNKDDTAVDGFADTWRLMQLGYKDADAAEIQEQLHVLHAVMEQPPQTARAPHLRSKRTHRGTKTPAGARWNVIRERHIQKMSPEEFGDPVDPHPNRKVSKTRIKAALLVNCFHKKMNEGCAG